MCGFGAAHRQARGIEQPDLHEHGGLVPIDVFVRDLAVLNPTGTLMR